MANGYQTNISTKSYRGIQVYSLCTIEENLVDVGRSRHKKLCRDQNCVATTGAFGQNVPTFGCHGDMSPTCRQLYQPSSSLRVNIPPLLSFVGTLYHIKQEGVDSWTGLVLDVHGFLLWGLGWRYNCRFFLFRLFFIFVSFAHLLLYLPEAITLLLLGNVLEALLFHLVCVRQRGSLLLFELACLFCSSLVSCHFRWSWR